MVTGSVLAVGEADGRSYLAVRYVEGRSLAERLAAEFGDHPDVAAARMRWAIGS